MYGQDWQIEEMFNIMTIYNKIKFNIRQLLIACMILFSNSLSAGIGDVYYCEMTQFTGIKDHETNNYYLEKFKFKRDLNQITFGNDDNFFTNYSMTVSYNSGELFDGYELIEGSIFGQFSYFDGNFIYSRSDYNEGTLISAICSLF